MQIEVGADGRGRAEIGVLPGRDVRIFVHGSVGKFDFESACVRVITDGVDC